MSEQTAAARKHEITVTKPSLYDGYTAKCSCGWRSEEMAYAGAAAKKASEHEKEVASRG